MIIILRLSVTLRKMFAFLARHFMMTVKHDCRQKSFFFLFLAWLALSRPDFIGTCSVDFTAGVDRDPKVNI